MDDVTKLLSDLGVNKPQPEYNWKFDGKTDGTPDTELRSHMEHSRIFAATAEHRFITGMRQQTLNELLADLPEPGTDLYIIGNGSGAERRDGSDTGVYDFGSFVPYLIDKVSPDPVDLYISTWSMNKRSAVSVVDMVQSGRVRSFTLCTDQYFNRREVEIANYLLEHMQGPGNNYISFKNHAKIIAVGNASACATITGSANLASQPRVEQYNLSTSRDVFNFYVENFFEWAINKLNEQKHGG